MHDTGTHDLMVMKAREMLLDGAGISVDRMPLLHVIFERMAAQCSEGLRQLSASPALFLVESVVTERIADVLDSYDGNAVFGIIHVQAWDSRLLIGLEHDFVFSLVEALFGGDGSETSLIEKRQFSNIELRLAKKAFDLFAQALQNSFASVCETVFKLDRVETRLDFVAIAPRTAFGVRARLKLRILGREGNLFVLIPQSALNSVRQDLVRDVSAEVSVRDPRWSRQIQNEISQAEIAIRGIIEERHFSLEDIAGLKIGQVLNLEATAKTRVKLECNAEHLFWCDLGQADGFYTLRIQELVSREQELIDDILPH
ncbi:MAG TPA: FliM/FliN family flagellar motor switch protein [Methylocella sp.]|nr:FliM/FliN family flagellar motor switch protein [Methylocella sp.]